MTIDSTAEEPFKSAFCWHCRTSRLPAEIVETRTSAGRKVRRCTHCIKKAAKAHSIRGTRNGRSR